MPPRAKKAAPTKKVDETVENQENPIRSEEQRESTNPEPEVAEVPEMAPANEVDDVVFNQENPGVRKPVDRNPDPVIHEDSNGIKFDVSKPYPELMSDDKASAARKEEIRQENAVLAAKDIQGADDEENADRKHITVKFIESGLSVQGRVWRAGQTLVMEDSDDNREPNKDTEGNVWYELLASEQKDRYGKVFFEKE
jgi:hypothetical protein